MEFTKEELNIYSIFTTTIVDMANKYKPNEEFIKSITGQFKSKKRLSGKQLGAVINMIGLDNKDLY